MMSWFVWLQCILCVSFSGALVALPRGGHVDQIDYDSIVSGLGYMPANMIDIAARSSVDERPIVLKSYPLGGGAVRRRAKAMEASTPFPTLYWLSCSKLQTAISDLERRGFVRELEHYVRKNLTLTEQMRHCHESYAIERWITLTENDRNLLLSEGQSQRVFKSLKETGVAGAKLIQTENNSEGKSTLALPSVKCLHAHYAHFRSGGRNSNLNIIGKLTQELLESEYEWCL